MLFYSCFSVFPLWTPIGFLLWGMRAWLSYTVTLSLPSAQLPHRGPIRTLVHLTVFALLWVCKMSYSWTLIFSPKPCYCWFKNTSTRSVPVLHLEREFGPLLSTCPLDSEGQNLAEVTALMDTRPWRAGLEFWAPGKRSGSPEAIRLEMSWMEITQRCSGSPTGLPVAPRLAGGGIR